MRVLLLGAPGVGKGSQAVSISKKLGIPHISTGDIFRENIAQQTHIGLMVKEYMVKGMLVPDELTVQIVTERLAREDCKNGFILDGFPRTVQQASSLDGLLEKMNAKLDMVINLFLDDSRIISRILGRVVCSQCGEVYHVEAKPPQFAGRCDNCEGFLYQREDDSVETIENRLRIYHQQTKPVVDYYSGTTKMAVVESCHDMRDTMAAVFLALGIDMSTNAEQSCTG